jgi:hypothetical protein
MTRANQAHKVMHVSSEWIGGFQVLAPDFFVIPKSESNFEEIYKFSLDKTHPIDDLADRIANGLFCIFKSLNLPAPVVRLSDNDAIGDAICKRLASLFGKSQGKEAGSSRPLLVLLYRFNDLHSILYHGWNYLTMISDVFSIRNNSFAFSEDPNSPDTKTYEIDFKEDPILNENAFRRFDEACENVNKSFDSWKKEYDQINSSTSAAVHDISSALTSAMDALPAMTEKKKKVDMHVQIASKMLSEVKRRDLDKL